jgi:hypothetical protein
MDGFEGAACERLSCPGACSGHGVCHYVEQLSNGYAATNWDNSKVQGCKCDPGYSGDDCSRRMCPIGDDPMTVASSLDGQHWNLTVSTSAAPTRAEIHLDITSLETGATVSSRPIDIVSGSAADITDVLYDTGIIKSVTSTHVSPSNTEWSFEFILVNPLRLGGIRVRWEDDCVVAGCQPLKQSSLPVGVKTAGSATIVAQPDSLAESAVCANRGVCDAASGDCQCFEGFYGRSCEMQTVLI